MKLFYALLPALLFLFAGSFLAFGQGHPIKRLDFEPEIHYCPVSFEVDHHYVPRRASRSNLRNKRDTEFVVTYDGGITAEARAAFENGVLVILDELFDSPVPISIHMDWESLDEGVLAGASPTAFYTRLPNGAQPDVVYPVALAEKIVRFPLNDPEVPDIRISVNSEADWYYDFENPDGIGSRFDFVTVLLHEMLHGLGFTAVTAVDFQGIGSIRRFPSGGFTIYTDFIFNGDGEKLSIFPDSTMLLGDQLQGDDLFFRLISSEQDPKLFVPDEFNRGSSISHVDEATYNDTESALMTPQISPGAVELDPGLALDMMYDMGWDFTYLLHNPQPGKEDFTEPQLLEVEVISDSEYDPSSLVIHYSRDSFTVEDIVEPLIFNPATGRYEATLPAPGDEITYQYYFSVVNSRNVPFTNPGDAPTNTFEYRYQVDQQAPVVQHSPPEEIVDVDSQLVVEAEITDVFLGVESASVSWRINGMQQEAVLMERQPGFSPGDSTDQYRATLVFPDGPLSEGDTVEYQIVATDKSMASNISIGPDSGYYKVPVVPVQQAVVTYLNDFNSATDDFTGSGFSIREEAGFDDMAIHSTHPYPEAGAGNFRNLTYELTIPIIIRAEEPLIEFDEVVLVEVGEPGTAFGDDEFWDYVIVEGKKVGASEWIPFLPGYDSGDNSTWRGAYNRNEDGRAALFFPRSIDMTAGGDFSPGDEVFIRFRLFSDPFSNAWGWAIDNLRIQDQTTAVSTFIDENSLTLFPNPVDGNDVLVSMDLQRPAERIDIRLLDMNGRRIAAYRVAGTIQQIRQRIPMTQLPPGMYIVQVAFNDRVGISRKIIRH